MFCPKCAAQNVDSASFCRSCGANISLVPQALSGQIPAAPLDRFSQRMRRREEASVDTAVRSLMMGVIFAVIAVLVSRFSPGGSTWWFWLLIPAMGMFGKGFSHLLRLNRMKDRADLRPQIPNRQPINMPPAPRTGELQPPVPSVTEGTTRHLAPEARTRQLDDQRPS